MTPLTVPKRNQHTLNFNGPLAVVANSNNTSVGAQLRQTPYPSFISSIDATNSDNYQFAFLRPNGDTFGVFYPAGLHFPAQPFFITLNQAANEAAISGYDAAATNCGYKIFSALSANTYVLGPPKLPPDGLINNAPNRTIGTLTNRYSFGYGIHTFDLVSNIYISETNNTSHNAFILDPLFSDYGGGGIPICELNVGGFFYTFAFGTPVTFSGNEVFMCKWQMQPYNVAGPFTYTNYQLTLSDATDNTLYQTVTDYNNENYHIFCNWNEFVFVVNDPTGLVTNMFVFAPDFTWYDSYTINFDPSIAALFPNLFRDVEGNNYAIAPVGSGIAQHLEYQIVNPVTAVVSGNLQLGDPMSLGCYSPCANLLYTKE